MPFLRRAALLAALLPGVALADGIEVHDPYLVATRPDAPTASAYMVIHNHGGPDDRLLSAASPAAREVTLHDSSEDANGVVRMVEVADGIALPRDGEVALAPGGLHLMLTGVAEPLEDGASLPLTLVFEAAGEVAVEVPVDLGRLGGQGDEAGGMEHMDMDHMDADDAGG